MTRAESLHMERVAGLPCVICYFKLGQQTYSCEAHHNGEASDRDNWATVPLCHEHHQGPTGIHGLHRRGFYKFWKISEQWLLARTNELLAKFADSR